MSIDSVVKSLFTAAKTATKKVAIQYSLAVSLLVGCANGSATNALPPDASLDMGAVVYADGSATNAMPPDAGLDMSAVVCTDKDGDNFYSTEKCGTAVDCNDADTSVWQTMNTYADIDHDGFGAGKINQICAGSALPAGFALNNQDCDDYNFAIRPGMQELCDGIDNDCDILSVDGFSEGAPLNSIQYGVCLGAQQLCIDGAWIDNYASILGYEPNREISCDGFDNNCDNAIDELVTLPFYQDIDGDGFGTTSNVIQSCTQPEGYANNSLDCNDNNNAINPSIEDICDSINNDCDDEVDEDAGGCPECLEGVIEEMECETDSVCRGYQTRECINGRWEITQDCEDLNLIVDSFEEFGASAKCSMISGDNVTFIAGAWGNERVYLLNLLSGEMNEIGGFGESNYVDCSTISISETGLVYSGEEFIGEPLNIYRNIHRYDFETGLTNLVAQERSTNFLEPHIDNDGRIVYVRGLQVAYIPDSDLDIFLINTRGERERVTSDYWTGEFSPVISGNLIAYFASRMGRDAGLPAEVRVYDLSTNSTRVSIPLESLQMEFLGISMNEQYLAFSARVYRGLFGYKLFIYDLDGNLIRDGGSDTKKRWPSINHRNLVTYTEGGGATDYEDVFLYNIETDEHFNVSRASDLRDISTEESLGSDKIVFTSTEPEGNVYLCELKDEFL